MSGLCFGRGLVLCGVSLFLFFVYYTFFFFLMIRRPPRSTHCISSAASDVYKRQVSTQSTWDSYLGRSRYCAGIGRHRPGRPGQPVRIDCRSGPHGQKEYSMKGHVARKRFGQNFLVDHGIIAAIISAIDPKRDETVVEIGPGLGAITEPVMARVDHLHVVEIDRDLNTAKWSYDTMDNNRTTQDSAKSNP
eukprot:TRINITY_DN5084_c0_g1_i1.p1 TRINITY_DN5084_c0_g1~~TRINITY_DN5084_c0_g1_i1.p1  ORF type:complete len:191 (+),score=23.01 TRINITY_DN5084_c0_g1_i1:56-628(+)